MPSTRTGLRRAALAAVAVVLLAGVVVVPTAAATASVTGSLTYREKIALTPAAVAIVTIIDTTAAPDAGAVIGQQVINGPTAVPIDFSVLVDAATIDQTHAYALFATIIDGTSTWENARGRTRHHRRPDEGHRPHPDRDPAGARVRSSAAPSSRRRARRSPPRRS